MTTPINLNKFRKKKARADKEKRASENRVKFGRTKSEKQLDAAKREKQGKNLEAHKRSKDDQE